jgi:AcrR family transcriptional regulator
MPPPSLKRVFQCQNAPVSTAEASNRQVELLEAAYAYVLANGLGDMSLRPLAAAIGSSPRVLLYLFGSKDGLIRALLARARQEELAFLAGTGRRGLPELAREVWSWLSAPAHRSLLTLWTEAYARSLLDPGGPWSAFAADTVRDWLALLAAADPSAGEARCTEVLAVLRGAMLDLLATGDEARTTAAVEAALSPHRTS